LFYQPSERDPGACMMLLELLNEAGCPPGVVNAIHGTHDSVNFICDHPDIKAISFVGGDKAVCVIRNFSTLFASYFLQPVVIFCPLHLF